MTPIKLTPADFSRYALADLREYSPEWHRIENRARQYEGRDCNRYLTAAYRELGDADLEWPADIRDALLELGCELTCADCVGGGGCSCTAPLCVCCPCSTCGGSGTTRAREQEAVAEAAE